MKISNPLGQLFQATHGKKISGEFIAWIIKESEARDFEKGMNALPESTSVKILCAFSLEDGPLKWRFHFYFWKGGAPYYGPEFWFSTMMIHNYEIYR